MKGLMGWSLVFVIAGILLTLFLIGRVFIPMILRSTGETELADLVTKLQNIQKYGDEGVTLAFPHYIDRVEFHRGKDLRCLKNCKDICTDKEGNPFEGKTLITMRIDKGAKPSIGSILWNSIFSPQKAKSDAVKKWIILGDQCFPEDFESVFETSKYIEYGGCALVLPGDKKEIKKYCIETEEKTGRIHVNVKEGEC